MTGRSDGRRQLESQENEVQRRERLTVFRPESAPTLLAPGPLDMSPEASLSGPPSAHDLSTDGMGELGKIIFYFPFSSLSYQ